MVCIRNRYIQNPDLMWTTQSKNNVKNGMNVFILKNSTIFRGRNK